MKIIGLKDMRSVIRRAEYADEIGRIIDLGVQGRFIYFAIYWRNVRVSHGTTPHLLLWISDFVQFNSFVRCHRITSHQITRFLTSKRTSLFMKATKIM